MAESMSERGLERRHGLEIFLRLAAYRATHRGDLPPINSHLWSEYMRLKAEGGHGDGPFGPRRRWFHRRHDAERERRDARPLAPYKIEKPFLTDDHTPEKVEARLETWPMVSAFGLVDRHPMGEWFIYCIEVLAEDLRQAVQIVECIFAVPCPA
jgi:hypothetical protein